MRAKRVCPRPGCPVLIDASQRLCPDHAREADRARGTKTERGYGADFQRARRQWARVVAQGRATCAKCSQPILAGTPWDLGHTDDRTALTGPEHAHCNRADGGRRAHQ